MRTLKEIAPGLYMMATFLGNPQPRDKATHIEALLKGNMLNYFKNLGTPASAIEAIIALTSKK